MKPRVSVVIPTLNAGPGFPCLLEKLSAQAGFSRLEIVVIDSGSSDGTVDVARRCGAKVVEVPPGSFDHGLTRNQGIQEASGEICVLLVQDAMPAHDHLLETIIQHFGRDPLIAGVTTRQIPRPQVDIVSRWENQYHTKFLGSKVKVRYIPDWNTFLQLPFFDRLFLCNFDNVCSALRRSVWEKHPFRSVLFAEDMDWAVRVLRDGYKIVYEPAAVVVHSHDRAAIYHMRRQYISAKVVPEILQCAIPGLFASGDRDFFEATNFLMQEVFSLLLLLGQLDKTITPALWREWTRLAGSQGLDSGGRGAQKRQFLAYAYARSLGRWLPLPRRTRSRVRNMLQATLLPASARHNLMRTHFYFLLSEVVQDASEVEPSTLRYIVVHCLARTLGGFLGNYYLSCERQEKVSPQFRALDQALCRGV